MSYTEKYLLLAAAIVAEVVATTALAKSESFTRPVPAVVTVLAYSLAFYFLSFPLRMMPTGIVYAMWSGLGIVLITAIGWIWYGQGIDFAGLLGMGLIAGGVIVIHTFSKTTSL